MNFTRWLDWSRWKTSAGRKIHASLLLWNHDTDMWPCVCWAFNISDANVDDVQYYGRFELINYDTDQPVESKSCHGRVLSTSEAWCTARSWTWWRRCLTRGSRASWLCSWTHPELPAVCMQCKTGRNHRYLVHFFYKCMSENIFKNGCNYSEIRLHVRAYTRYKCTWKTYTQNTRLPTRILCRIHGSCDAACRCNEFTGVTGHS